MVRLRPSAEKRASETTAGSFRSKTNRAVSGENCAWRIDPNSAGHRRAGGNSSTADINGYTLRPCEREQLCFGYIIVKFDRNRIAFSSDIFDPAGL